MTRHEEGERCKQEAVSVTCLTAHRTETETLPETRITAREPAREKRQDELRIKRLSLSILRAPFFNFYGILS